MKTKHYTLGTILGAILLLVGVWVQAPRIVHADDTNFSDGITVDSTDDTPDANVGDNICDDGDGACTLRAAIQESNATAGTQTINFNLTGGADFTVTDRNNVVRNGYTIAPTGGMPSITAPVTINGYSQPGSLANNAVAPEPLNGTLLVEIDGNLVNGGGFSINASNVSIRGLVINSFNGTAIGVGPSTIIQGNYIGSDPAGLVAKSDGADNNGINSANPGATDVIIGGLDAEDRNLISGNTGSGITPNNGDNNWTIQGNYVGVDKTGLVALPNSYTGGPAGLSLDNSDGHIVGGSQTGAANVIAGNMDKGIAPNNTNNTLIEGNFISVGFDGTTPITNHVGGIAYSGVNADFRIINNIISHDSLGIYINEAQDAVIQGNKIMHNSYGGIYIASSSNIVIGGNAASERNIISDNNRGDYNVGDRIFGHSIAIYSFMTPTTNVTIQGNYIGVDEDGRVDSSFSHQLNGIFVSGNVSDVLIGGAGSGEGNIIAGSKGPGVAAQEIYAPSIPASITPTRISILGNSIHTSSPNSVIDTFDPTGLGIDLFQQEVDGTLTPSEFHGLGVSANDTNDIDTGPNNNINFPVLNSAKQTGTSLALNYDLDAADSPSDEYRVEFFANDTADSSGYGEGQTFLGAVTAGPGDGNTATLTLPSSMDLTGKVISATTTAIDSTTDSGFGSTSEFGAVLAAEVIAPVTRNPTTANTGGNLAKTGQNTLLPLLAGTTLISVSLATMIASRKYTYRARP